MDRVSHSVWVHGEGTPPSYSFFRNLTPINTDSPHAVTPSTPPAPPLPLKNEAPELENIPPLHHWKVKLPSRKWFLEKKTLQIHHENMSVQNFVRKVKQFVRKYSFTWLIDLGNKLHDIEKILDFIVCHLLLKIVLFY